MMDYENVLLLFLSFYGQKKGADGKLVTTEQEYKYKYDNKGNGQEEIFAGRQTNEAPVNCLISLRKQMLKFITGKRHLIKFCVLEQKKFLKTRPGRIRQPISYLKKD